jgi:hypothetical protein
LMDAAYLVSQDERDIAYRPLPVQTVSPRSVGLTAVRCGLIVAAFLHRAMTQTGRLGAIMITRYRALVRGFFHEEYNVLSVYRNLEFEESVTPIRSTCRMSCESGRGNG